MTRIFYAGGGRELDQGQKRLVDAVQAFLALAARIVEAFGLEAVLGGLITAYVHIAHQHGVHQEAVNCLETAIANLRNPEAISIKVQGRA